MICCCCFVSSVERTGRTLPFATGGGIPGGAVFPAREEPADPLRHLQRCASAQLCRLHHERGERRPGDDLIHHFMGATHPLRLNVNRYVFAIARD